MAFDEATCAIDFSVAPEPPGGTGGIWDPISYAVDATGEGLVLFGTADPDSKVYAIDATTGATVWTYAVANPPPGLYDVGAGVVASPPGANGFADGVAYVESKDAIMYALNLTTGAVIWQTNFAADGGGFLSTAALSGTNLVVGTGSGAVDFNAVTGAVIWNYDTGGDVDASPSIIGPVGHQVVALTDLGGAFRALALKSGVLLYRLQTGNLITSSVGDQQGNLFFISGDGFLYDLTAGGNKLQAPRTAVTTPASQSTIPNPGGSVALAGTATGTTADPVAAVTVAIQSGGSNGLWWDSATSTWTASPYPNPATLATPGAATSTWTAAFPVTVQGGSFEAFASAVNPGGAADISGSQTAASPARSTFTVLRSPSATPQLSVAGMYVAPLGSVAVSGSGFKASEKVAISIAGATIATATATAAGKLKSTPVTIPSKAVFGPQALVATGETSGATASAQIYVTNSANQFGQSATHPSSDPNDR